jgi:signal transduction histidine kinase
MSIRAYILAFMGVLVAAALASAVTVMLVEFGELTEAGRSARMTAAFDGVLMIQERTTRERGYYNARLLGNADVAERDVRNTETDRTFDAGIRALDRAEPDGSSVHHLNQIRDDFVALRAAAIRESASGTVQNAAAATYVDQTIGLMDRLDAIADKIEREATAGATPLARSYIELARLAAILRDQAGRRASHMVELATARRPVTTATAEAFGAMAGEVHSIWRRLDQVAEVSRQIAIAQGTPFAPALDAAITDARLAYVGEIEPMYRETMAAAGAGMPSDAVSLRDRQVIVLAKINVVRTIALRNAAAAVAEDEHAAMFELVKAGALLLVVAVGSIAAVLFLHRRVIAPLTSLTHIVSRLADNRRDDAVPALERPDEIGRLARAIETLRRTLERASRAERERQAIELQLRQAQKLESLGTLAGGIAHEINTPVQYVGDNVRFLETSFADLAKVVDSGTALRRAVADEPRYEALAAAVAQAETDADLGFLRDEVPTAIAQSLDGIDRIRQIVLAVKEFSHPDVKELAPLDLNHAIDTTITVSRNQWKYIAEMITELSPELPLVPCRGGEINQVILNLIVNAAHAIEAKDAGIGTITVTTGVRDGCAEIKVRDTGTGMPAELIGRIFDPFFTTKAPGKGTGQGLAICHTIVVQKHGGTILVDSVPGEGTCFTVRLPLEQTGEVGLAA